MKKFLISLFCFSIVCLFGNETAPFWSLGPKFSGKCGTHYAGTGKVENIFFHIKAKDGKIKKVPISFIIEKGLNLQNFQVVHCCLQSQASSERNDDLLCIVVKHNGEEKQVIVTVNDNNLNISSADSSFDFEVVPQKQRQLFFLQQHVKRYSLERKFLRIEKGEKLYFVQKDSVFFEEVSFENFSIGLYEKKFITLCAHKEDRYKLLVSNSNTGEMADLCVLNPVLKNGKWIFHSFFYAPTGVVQEGPIFNSISEAEAFFVATRAVWDNIWWQPTEVPEVKKRKI